MPAGQKKIYYLTSETLEQSKKSPYLERLQAKGFEVILFSDPIDEWVVDALDKYQEKEFLSVTAADLELDSEEDKKKKETASKEDEEKFKPLMTTMQAVLAEHLEEVKLSDRLTDSPVCLVQNGTSARMERLMEQMGQPVAQQKRVLEINPKHPLFEKMKDAPKEQQEAWADILFNQALLSEGRSIPDPLAYTKKIADLMLASVK